MPGKHHGMSKHPAYKVWVGMLSRCYLPTHVSWYNYGGRGIKVCDEWRNSFINFWADMGSTYVKGLTLERKDNNADYSRDNCEWATHAVQRRNTRFNHMLDTPWGRMTAKDAAMKAGIGYMTLLSRIKRNSNVPDLFCPTLRKGDLHKMVINTPDGVFTVPELAKKFNMTTSGMYQKIRYNTLPDGYSVQLIGQRNLSVAADVDISARFG